MDGWSRPPRNKYVVLATVITRELSRNWTTLSYNSHHHVCRPRGGATYPVLRRRRRSARAARRRRRRRRHLPGAHHLVRALLASAPRGGGGGGGLRGGEDGDATRAGDVEPLGARHRAEALRAAELVRQVHLAAELALQLHRRAACNTPGVVVMRGLKQGASGEGVGAGGLGMGATGWQQVPVPIC